MCEFSIDEYLKTKKKFRREHKAQKSSYAPVFKVAHKHLIWRMEREEEIDEEKKEIEKE